MKRELSFNEKMNLLLLLALTLATVGNLLVAIVQTRWDSSSLPVGFMLIFISAMVCGIVALVYTELVKK